MSNLTLYLLRHGESVANVERVFAARKIDPPLSEIGIQQATMQAKSLREIGVKSQFEFSALYASPLLRTKHTANIVGQHCGLEPILSDDLMEIDVGILDGEYQEDKVKWSIYEAVIEKWNQGLHNLGFPGGESLDDVKFRFSRFLNDALLFQKRASLESRQSKQGEHILIVGHCLLFMAVIWLFCENRGLTLEDGHMGRGHLSIISQNSDRFRLLKFNLSPESPVENR